jgi:hypothetical protein
MSRVCRWIADRFSDWAFGKNSNQARARSLTNWNRFHFYEPRYPTQHNSICICGLAKRYCPPREVSK